MGKLSGAERLKILDEKLGAERIMEFKDGSEGFLVQQIYDDEFGEQYALATFTLFRPHDLFTFRVSKGTGLITEVSTLIIGDGHRLVANLRSRKSKKRDADMMVDGYLRKLSAPTVSFVGYGPILDEDELQQIRAQEMARKLTGVERLKIIDEKMARERMMEFKDGSQGFMIEQTFDEEFGGEYVLATFLVFRPEDLFAFRISKLTGEISDVYTMVVGDGLHLVANTRSRKSKRRYADAMVDGVLRELSAPTVKFVSFGRKLDDHE